MVFINSVSWPYKPLILSKKQLETVKEYTSIWELYAKGALAMQAKQVL